MSHVNTRDLLTFAIGLEGKRLTTLARGASFRIRVLPHGLEITPASSRTPRIVRREIIDRVCEAYRESRSARTRDYQAISFDASYLLALIDRYSRANGLE